MPKWTSYFLICGFNSLIDDFNQPKAPCFLFKVKYSTQKKTHYALLWKLTGSTVFLAHWLPIWLILPATNDTRGMCHVSKNKLCPFIWEFLFYWVCDAQDRSHSWLDAYWLVVFYCVEIDALPMHFRCFWCETGVNPFCPMPFFQNFRMATALMLLVCAL